MKLLKNKNFWIGVVVGTVAGRIVTSKVSPQLAARLPG